MQNKSVSPENILPKTIQKKHLYCDKKSKESFTNRTRRKYKLAGNCLIEQCFFHVLTSTESACKKHCTLTLYLKDWENRIQCFKLADTGYCDLTKFEIIQQPVLLKKIKDKNNGFPYVAKLSDNKYRELTKLTKNLHRYPRVSKEIRQIINEGISPSYDSILSKLDLD